MFWYQKIKHNIAIYNKLSLVWNKKLFTDKHVHINHQLLRLTHTGTVIIFWSWSYYNYILYHIPHIKHIYHPLATWIDLQIWTPDLDYEMSHIVSQRNLKVWEFGGQVFFFLAGITVTFKLWKTLYLCNYVTIVKG